MRPRLPACLQVCEDLKRILRIDPCEFFRASINRPNLYYEVLHKPLAAADATAAVVQYIRMHYGSGESGIVYCLTRYVVPSTESLHGMWHGMAAETPAALLASSARFRTACIALPCVPTVCVHLLACCRSHCAEGNPPATA